MKVTKFVKANPRQSAIIVAITIVVLYFAYKKFQEWRFTTVKFDKKNIPVDELGNPWNPEPLAREIFENLEGMNWLVHRSTSIKVLDLNEDQTKFLYNYYNKYMAVEYPTLTQLFENEWNQAQGRYAEVVARLKSYGLD